MTQYSCYTLSELGGSRMDALRGPVGKWLLSAVYLSVWVGLSLLLPWGLGSWLIAVHLSFAAWLYLSNDSRYGRSTEIRPLTPWDVPDYRFFRGQLRAACQDLGLPREPVWAVADEDELNAWAVSGRSGVVVFTRKMLRTLPPDEVLAVAGHELFHLRSRDSLPAIVGGAWLMLVGQFSAWCQTTGRNLNGLMALPFLVLALVLDLVLWIVGYLADIVLATRSRSAEHLADLAGARITSVDTMCAALQRLDQQRQVGRKSEQRRWSPAWLYERLHASHPPTPERLAYLRGGEDL